MSSSCKVSYAFNGASIDYTKTKTISIATFPIKSDYVYAPLGTKFNEQLKDVYVRQTRLRQVKANGDLQIDGEITGYHQYNEAVKADGYSSEIKLQIDVRVRFTNNANHTADFEQTFSASQNYAATKTLTSVQDELIDTMVKDICDQIFNATVANW
jgi:hypothetical protein